MQRRKAIYLLTRPSSLSTFQKSASAKELAHFYVVSTSKQLSSPLSFLSAQLVVRDTIQKAKGTRMSVLAPSKSLNGTVPLGGLQLQLQPTRGYKVDRYPNNHSTTNNLKGDPSERPLVVILPWLGARTKHVQKFVEIYQFKGYDCISAQIYARHFLWPSNTFPAVDSLCAELRSPDYSQRPLIFHSFSVGSYFLSVLFLLMRQNQTAYTDISSRILGFVTDSATVGGHSQMANGVVTTLTNSAVARAVSKVMILTYFQLSYPWTVKIYEKLIESFHKYPIKQAPTLYFYSHDDPMSDPVAMRDLIQGQINNGYDISFKNWESSPHAQHYVKHTDEYMEHLNVFLKKIDPGNPEIVKSRL